MAKLPPRWPPSGHLGPTTLIRSEKGLRSRLPCLFAQDGQDGHPFPPRPWVIPAASAGRKCELSSRIWTTDYWLLTIGCGLYMPAKNSFEPVGGDLASGTEARIQSAVGVVARESQLNLPSSCSQRGWDSRLKNQAVSDVLVPHGSRRLLQTIRPLAIPFFDPFDLLTLNPGTEPMGLAGRRITNNSSSPKILGSPSRRSPRNVTRQATACPSALQQINEATWLYSRLSISGKQEARCQRITDCSG